MKSIIEQLKDLPITAQFEQDTQGVYGEIVEFPDEFEEEATQEDTIKELAKGLKGWACVLAGEGLKGVDTQQVPYILKALVSTEEEIIQCLKNSK